MWTVFISYRRGDSAPYAGRIHDRLVAHFGNNSVFMDITAIDIGEDFEEAIARTVSTCNVLIALIGPRWLTETNAKGKLRLEDRGDYVGLEIAAALERGIRVIPALVGDAEMPTPSDLPENLQKLARRQAIEISDSRFHQDVDRLIAVLEKMQSKAQASAAPPPSPEEAPAPPPAPARADRDWRPRRQVFVGLLLTLVLLLIGVASWKRSLDPISRYERSETAATKTSEPAAPLTQASNPPASSNAPATTSGEVPKKHGQLASGNAEGIALVHKVARFVGNVSSLKTIGQKGSMTVQTPQGEVQSEVNVVTRYPNARRVELKMPMGDLTNVISPNAAFMISPMGIQNLSTSQRDAALSALRSELIAVMKNVDNPKYTFNAGAMEGDARTLAIDADGAMVTWLVEPGTGRVVRTISHIAIPAQAGEVTEVTELNEWKTFQGLHLPTFTITSRNGKQSSRFYLTEVQTNPSLAANAFTKP